jgi:hypothetical protein
MGSCDPWGALIPQKLAVTFYWFLTLNKNQHLLTEGADTMTTEKLLKIADQIADLTPNERTRLGRILVHEYSLETCELQDGIEDGFITLEKELELV